MSKETLISYLNKQLHSEYQAMHTYMYHAATLQNEELAAALREFCREEQNHAIMLMDLIEHMGGVPEASCEVNVDQEDDILSSLVMSIAEEDSAVQMYTMIRDLMETPAQRTIIESTIAEEKRHHAVLQDLLAKAKKQMF
ncbi:ferritin-like domain-containing protein [Desulfurispira natronophila]|uniref:Rubrerythrin n=1 Tax=Desulfurispira natronophila TaxID=682562 RepID=A0A7W7Y2X0_9BACT|nr:ferritin-like domain-containing protein [Desulfurispira natronophila]MBB5020949.1 rubrerythrin [Desulfurispira natronophila]